MMKENFEEKRVCEGNVVHVTQTFDIPRYTGRIFGNCQGVCDVYLDMISNDCMIWCGSRNFKHISNIEFEPGNGHLQDDLKKFQKMLDEQFGKDKYEAFVLGAYIHSGTSFSISKTGDHRCRFDSSQLGFIGVPNESKETTSHNYIASEVDSLAKDLTACWNGEFLSYQVVDEETGDTIDEVCDYDYHTLREFSNSAKEKYGIDFNGIDIIY